MPDGLEDTKRFLIPVESTTVSVNDEEPETLTVTDVEAVWLVLSVTLTVYAVVVAGFATGLARVGSLNEAVGLHAKLYGGAPPVTLALSCEVFPALTVVGIAVAETVSGATTVTNSSP
jgi:hypothetical protein